MNLSTKTLEKTALETLAKGGLGPLTIDDFLGGAVRLIQLEKGYRAGMDAVLLAAAVPCEPGEKGLDIGAATGAVSLCLARRCAGIEVDGIEIQPHLVDIARANIALNGFEGRVRTLCGSITDNGHEIPDNAYDHVFANPPYLEETQAIAPPAETKGIAYVGGEATLEKWVMYAVAKAKHKGTLTFIFRADRIHELTHHLYGRAGELVVFPLWPREGEVAKRVIVQARKGLHGGATVTPGMALHGTAERYSKAAEGVLRRGEAIDLAQYHRGKRP